ncbi:translocation/assembly module TamB domain-containing protein [Flavobacterium sp.]|uniref:translocation/assembly module TamB domain-containing protein n=1 Tax=Flavobacterium sp. TaxID=239 RepID=UPI00260FB1C8|nr:translocation/assembly module TamB domain-containing protein [Flavobacterium sp.]
MKQYFKKGAKILLWTILSLFMLCLLLVLIIQIPYVQNKIKDKAVTYLEGKIHTKVMIGHINIGFPKDVMLERVYLESQQKDTLLYGRKIAVNISLFKLLNSEVEINSIDLSGINAHISRNRDSVFNFDYIIKAFASKEDKPKSTTKTKISISDVNLDKIKLTFEDAITKNDLKASIEHFDTRIEKFDLDNLNFDVPKIKLDGLKLRLKQGLLAHEIAETSKKIADSLAKKSDLKLKLGQIVLSKIDVQYENAGTNLNTGLTLEKSLIRVNTFDLQKQIIDLESLDINKLNGGLTLVKKENKLPETKAAPNTKLPEKSWQIKLNQANLKAIAFRFNDENSVRTKKGIDYKHLDVKNFNLDGEQFTYSDQGISGKIYAFTVQEKSGVDVQSLKTEFYYGAKSAYLKKLYLKTPQTLVKNEIIVGYPSIESASKNVGQFKVDANLIGSQVGFKDILIFAPQLAETNPFKSNANAIVKINGKINGQVSNIRIQNLEISGIGNTKLTTSGTIVGLPDAQKAYFNMNIRQLETTSKDIYSFVPKNAIPSTIQLPAKLSTRGTFKGTMTAFLTNMNLTSSFGNATVKANFNSQSKDHEIYQANTSFSNFDLGKLLKNPALGKISLQANINGIGLNPKTAVASVDAKISSAQYDQYTYKNASIKGKAGNGLLQAIVSMKDPNLAFDLKTEGNFKDKYPAVKLKMNVDIADLEKLNLHAGPLKLKGQIDADFPTADIDYLNGKLFLHHLRIANAKNEFVLDTITVTATATAEKNTIAVRSQILDADVNGQYKLSQISNAITNSIAKYYNPNPTAKKATLSTQQLAFNVTVKDHPILFQLVPDLKSLEPIGIVGRYNSMNDTIVLSASIPKVIYQENTLTNGSINIDTKEDVLVYAVLVDDIQNASFQLPYTSLSGKIQNNLVDYVLLLKDDKDKERYMLAGTMKATPAYTEIKLIDKLTLNYEPWNMNPENMLRFGKNGIYANEVAFEKDNNQLSLQSESNRPNAPLNVEFKEFKIETLTNIAQKDSLTVGGKINGKAQVRDLMKTVLFTADLKVADFNFRKDTIGNLAIKVSNDIASTYKTNIVITGQDNNVVLDGNYNSRSNSIDMNLDLQQLNLKSVQGFSMGNITQGSGFFTGKFKVKGTPEAPHINGDLQFNEIAFRVKQFNSYFKSMNDKIVVNENGIVIDRFVVSDEQDNILVVQGTMPTTNFKDYDFNLSVGADNFRVLNSKEQDNKLFYGQLFVDTRLKIKGNTDKPIIDGNIDVNEDTKLTVVLPQQDPSIADREGIVEFIDQDDVTLNQKLIVNDTIAQTQLKGLEASVNIQIDKQAELTMIIDKGNGDYLKLKGEARLTGGIDSSGKTTLAGRYEFTEGTYEMTFSLLKRKFDIKEGSYILWTGEPTQADINITAVYKTDAAPIDLLGDQLGNVAADVRNTYKQKIPFETELIMKGELLKPDITFDIVLPEGNNSVSTEIINSTQTRLTQLRQEPSELNKQVFALLLLNRFIGENPFASESDGTSTNALARQSASKILSQQLNNLAGDLVKGVELDFDLESTDDYTTGERQNRTDLNVGVSQRLLDDRLKVTVGSSFALEGEQQANQQANNIAGDISADYQLSKDGRYRVRAYRKNQYQVALQGQVIETGVAFIITLNYDKFREIFHSAKKDKIKLEPKKKL